MNRNNQRRVKLLVAGISLTILLLSVGCGIARADAKSKAAQEAAEPSDAVVLIDGDIPFARGFRLGADRHRAELPHDERPAAIAHPLLPEESRPARIDPKRDLCLEA